MQNDKVVKRHEAERDGVLPEIANWVHDSVPVSKVGKDHYLLAALSKGQVPIAPAAMQHNFVPGS